MKESMKQKLENLVTKYNPLNNQLSAEDATKDLNIFKKILS